MITKACALSALLFLCACPSSDVPDAGGRPDAAARSDAQAGRADATATEDDASAPAEDAGRVPEDAGPRPDAAPIGAPFPIKVAYAATAADPGLLELFLTDTSTSRTRVHGALAGGPTDPGKGPRTSGVQHFEWSSSGEQLIYTAQQDTFDRVELYASDAAGRRPGPPRRISLAQATGEVSGVYLAPASASVAFEQSEDGMRSSLYVVSASDAVPMPRRISQGSPSAIVWSPARDELVFRDILESRNDRDLWFTEAHPRAAAPVRVNPGANVGFGGALGWAPDGSSFVYSADERAERLYELYRVPVTGGVLGARERIHPAFPAGSAIAVGADPGAAFSPDGTRAAYIADPRQARLDELFVVDVSGAAPGAPVPISADGAMGDGVVRFGWSGDGAHIVYASDTSGSGLVELFLADPSGATPAARISPDVGSGAIEREAWALGDRLVVMEANIVDVRQLFAVRMTAVGPEAAVPLSDPVMEGSGVAAWSMSPDGESLLYSVGNAGDRWSVYAVDLETLVTRLVARGRLDPSWCWAPQSGSAAAIAFDARSERVSELLWVADVHAPSLEPVSGPVVANGRITACAFPPAP